MNDGRTLAEAKRDFSAGFVAGYTIDRVPLGGGWVVQLKIAGQFFPLVDARSGAARAFKSLDSAVSALESIGFQVLALKAG